MPIDWTIRAGPDNAAEDLITERLVEYNKAQADIIRERFQPENLPSRALAFYAYDGDSQLIGGCTASTIDLWKWLTIDMMWVDASRRGSGLGRALLTATEDAARMRGCAYAKLNTWDFQAPAFYLRCGYVEYGREVDYPPGHTNYLMRKDL